MEQLREEDQVSMTIENPEMLLSSDSEAESSSNPRLEHNFRLDRIQNLHFIISSRPFLVQIIVFDILASFYLHIENMLHSSLLQVVQDKWDDKIRGK